jgi:hypothetical protein
MAIRSTTLTFDSFVLAEGGESRLANGYGGFNWQQAGIYNPDGAIAGYVASSGQNILFIAEAANNEVAGYEDTAAGSALVMSRETPFTLDTIQLSSAFRNGLTVTIRAYADQAGTVLIGEKTVTVDTAAQSLVSFATGLDFGTFSGATRIEFNANDNNAGTKDYFGIGNLTFHDTPSTVTLDFDDFALAPGAETVLGTYRGFTFSEAGVYRPDGAIPGYAAASGTNIGFIAEANNNEVSGYEGQAAGSPVVITNPDAFDFLGGAFSAAFRNGVAVTIRGYSDADGLNLVAAETIVVQAGSAQPFSFETFDGLRRLEFSSNDNDLTTNDYVGFDNLLFRAADVAAPGEGILI